MGFNEVSPLTSRETSISERVTGAINTVNSSTLSSTAAQLLLNIKIVGRHTSAGVFIHSGETWQAITPMVARKVDAHRVGLTVMHLRCTLINICGKTRGTVNE